MKINIQGFGLLGPMIGCQTIELETAACVADALNSIAASVPEFTKHQSRTATAIGEALVKPEAILEDGQTLVLIPPVGGG